MLQMTLNKKDWMNYMQVLKTKLSRPSMLNGRAMQRSQLLSQIVDYCQSSLVFIHAAAGYGKTTLMHQLSESLLAKGKKVVDLG